MHLLAHAPVSHPITFCPAPPYSCPTLSLVCATLQSDEAKWAAVHAAASDIEALLSGVPLAQLPPPGTRIMQVGLCGSRVWGARIAYENIMPLLKPVMQQLAGCADMHWGTYAFCMSLPASKLLLVKAQ